RPRLGQGRLLLGPLGWGPIVRPVEQAASLAPPPGLPKSPRRSVRDCGGTMDAKGLKAACYFFGRNPERKTLTWRSGPEAFDVGSRERIEGPSLRRRSWGRSLGSLNDGELCARFVTS